MDQVSAGKATRDGARARRRRMREQARSHAVQTPVTDRYQTPEWLERSFVLPLSSPEANDVPSQPVPSHDDDPGRSEQGAIDTLETITFAAPAVGVPDPVPFVRPPSEDIDFARVVRRADLCRRAGRLSWATGGVAGLALIAYLLTASVPVLGAAVVMGLAAAGALAVRFRLNSAPVPRLQR